MLKDAIKNTESKWYVFAEAIRTLLELDRRKSCNILLVGSANCGKTFLLNPLKEIYDTFQNPSSTKYAFVRTGSKELMFLNDLGVVKKSSPDKNS